MDSNTFDERIGTLAEQLIESDDVDVFEDSNAGQAAARAAADLVLGWNTYDEPYQLANAATYQPYDVDEVIAQLTAWKNKGCPVPKVKAGV